MSVGSVNEADATMSAVEQKLREASTETSGVIEFLDRMASELGGLGLTNTLGRIASVKQLVEEFVTELDGLSEHTGAIRNELLGLAER